MKPKGTWHGLGRGPEHSNVYLRHEPKKRASKRAEAERLSHAVQLWNSASPDDHEAFLGAQMGYSREDAREMSTNTWDELVMNIVGPDDDPNSLVKSVITWFPPDVTTESLVRKALAETKRRLLGEGPMDPEKEEGDSLDSQVDRYLGEYEAEAKNSQHEGFSFDDMTRRIVNEAEGEEGDEPAEDAPTKLGTDSINVESFANSVVRLIDNYDSLLEVRNTLVRRAKNFLNKSYSPEVLKMFETVLREQHGLVDGESKDEVEAEDFPAPPADRAGPGGGQGGAPA